MPKMEGTELATEFAKLRPGIPTLFMSGYTDHRLLEQIPRTNRPTVLQKPLNLHSLLAAIGGAIKKKT
jgi:DNA-binding NtrC family response regulator